MGKRKNVKTNRKGKFVAPGPKFKEIQDEIPNPSNRSFYYDDIDEFVENQDKVLLNTDDRNIEPASDSDVEDEVLAISSDEESNISDEEENFEGSSRSISSENSDGNSSSDVEDVQVDKDDIHAWGKRKDVFYSAPDQDSDAAAGSDAEMAEEEAMLLQRKNAEEFSQDDFGFDIVQNLEENAISEIEAAEIATEEFPVQLHTLTKKAKHRLLQKESPEFIPLVTDMNMKMDQVCTMWYPLLRRAHTVANAKPYLAQFIETRFHVTANYLINAVAYLAFKSKSRVVSRGHPVFLRLAQYRKILEKLEHAEKILQSEIKELFECSSSAKEAFSEDSNISESVFPRLKEFCEVIKKSEGEQKRDIARACERLETFGDGESSENEEKGEPDESKRAVGYQIEKNKSSESQKKKARNRNPRVKLRHKFTQAKKRRRGQVREVRTEKSRYGGEISGIRVGVIKSVKIK